MLAAAAVAGNAHLQGLPLMGASNTAWGPTGALQSPPPHVPLSSHPSLRRPLSSLLAFFPQLNLSPVTLAFSGPNPCPRKFPC